MALRQIRIGGNTDILQYDDGDYDKSIEVEDPISCTSAPVDGSDVLRKDDMPAIGEVVSSTNVIPDNAVVRGDGGARKIQGSNVLIDDSDKETIPGGAHIGGAANYIDITDSGVLTLHGTAKRTLTLRPEMDSVAQLAHSKPTQVSLGVYKGYSFPIYSADDEEIYFRETVPGRWDGKSDITFHIYIALAAAEDAGDRFQMRFSWEHSPEGEPVPITSNDVDVEQILVVGRIAQYDLYELSFVIDYDIDGVGNEIQPHELLGGRLRRIAATASEIDNEVILLDWHTLYTVDKMFRP
jgi:hypothetical protein